MNRQLLNKLKNESGMALTASTMFIFIILSIMAFYLARFAILDSASASNYIQNIRARNLVQTGLQIGFETIENSYLSFESPISGKLNNGNFSVSIDETNDEKSNILNYSHYGMLVSTSEVGGVSRAARVIVSSYPDAFNLQFYDGNAYSDQIDFPLWSNTYFQSRIDTITHSHAQATNQEVIGPSTTLNFDNLSNGHIIPTGYGGFDWYSSSPNNNNSNSNPDLTSYGYGNSYSGSMTCIPWFGRKENYIERQNGYFIFDNAYFGEQWGHMDNITLYGYKDGILVGDFNFSVQKRSPNYKFIQPNFGVIDKLKITSGSNSGWWRMDDFTYRTVSIGEAPSTTLTIANDLNLNAQYPNGLYQNGDIVINGCTISGTGRIFTNGTITLTDCIIGGGIELGSGESFTITGSTLGVDPALLSSSIVLYSNGGLIIDNSTVNGLVFSLGSQTRSSSSLFNGAFYTTSEIPEIINSQLKGSFVSQNSVSDNANSSTFTKGDLPPTYGKNFGFRNMVIPGSYLEY